MTFRGDDDYDYIDDEDYYDPDEDDEDEELGGDWRSRLGDRSSNLPGRNRTSPFGDSSNTSSNSTRSSVYGGNKPDNSSSDMRNKIAGYGDSSSSRSTFGNSGGKTYGGSSGSRDRSTRTGDTGKLRGGSPSNSPSGGKDWRSSLTGGSTSKSDKSPTNPKPPDKKNWQSQSSKTSTKGNNKKDDSKSRSRFGRGGKDDNKKDDKSGDGSVLTGLRNRMSSSGSNDSKDSRRSPGGNNKKDNSGGMLSGLRNRLPIGGDDSKDTRRTATKATSKDSSGGMLSGLRNRLPIGGDDSRGSRTSSRSTGGNKSAAATGGMLSGIRNRFSGGGDDSSKSSTRGSNDKKSGGSFRNKDNKSNKQSAFGASKATSSRSSSRGSSNDQEGGGGFFGNLFNRGTKDDKSARTSSRSRTSKAPKVASDDWFDLDRKLDLVGVGLVFGSILLFFSALSQEQAAISFVHNIIGQMFGWGAMAVPVSMFAVGMWLIVRHFGDDAPTIDPLRLAGVIIGFIGVLALFQYIDSFSYIEQIPSAIDAKIAACGVEFVEGCTAEIQNLSECQVAITPNCLEGLVSYSYQQNNGGGIVGGWLYLTLVQNVTEIGGFVIVAMVLTFAAMMVTHLSMAEIAIVVIGVGRSLRTSMAQSAAKRRAQRLKAQQQKALEAQTASVSVSTPAPAQLPGFTNATNALPEPSDDSDAPIPIEERDILIRRGGQAFSSSELEQQPVLLGNNAGQAQSQKSGGFLSGLFNRNKPQPSNPSTLAPAATATGGLMGRLFNRGEDKQQPIRQPQPTATPAPVQANNMPVGNGNVTQQPQQPQPVAQPQQQPAVAVESTAQTAQPVQNPAGMPTPPAQQPQPQQPQPVAQPTSQADAMTMRQDRLNAIRSGQTAPKQPPAQQPQPKQQQPVASNGGNGNNYNPFGRPDDIPTHESEKLPGQQFSTTTPITTSSQPSTPLINPQQNQVQKPVSSGPVNQSKPRTNWKLPDYRTLLASGSEQEFDREQLLNKARVIEETLASFGAPGRVVEVNTGPVITQFGVEPDYLTSRSGKKSRVKVSAIAQLDKDLQLALGAKSIRVEAPVPGKGYVGIEVPNTEASLVSLRDVMESEDFQKIKSPLAIALGMSVDGSPISADLTAMPHLLIAGTTGSGKSVCVNAIINSIIATSSPEIVKFIMVDPKRVELTNYNGLPHLVAPVVVELERIVGVLKWVTREMDERYKKFSNAGSRNIEDYNKHRDPNLEPMPYIVVIIDELADLMMLAPEETERTVTRIAALARATGIHLVIATQRPSVDVVTGLIKANFPARIAFAVAGGVDSRVILDQPGAERLLGKGDMLYLSGDSPAALRLQGVFVSDMEIDNISRYWKMQSAGVETIKPISVLTSQSKTENVQPASATGQPVRQAAFWDGGSSSSNAEPDDPQKLAIEDKTGNPDPQEDELYETAVQMVRRLDKASISLLQRRLRIGYTRAARLIDMMEEREVVGPAKDGSSKPRDVIPE